MAKRKDTKSEIVWKDRKRICGLPISFTKYVLQKDRLFVCKGFFNYFEDEILLYRIVDLSYSRTFADKIFGVGTILLITADKSSPEVQILRVKNSRNVRDTISEYVEGIRKEMGLSGREMYGLGGYSDDVIDTLANDGR